LGKSPRAAFMRFPSHKTIRRLNWCSARRILRTAAATAAPAGVTANTLNYPKGIAVYHDTLWVADYSSERVLRFDNAHRNYNEMEPAPMLRWEALLH